MRMEKLRADAPEPMPEACEATIEHREGQIQRLKLGMKRVLTVVGKEEDLHAVTRRAQGGCERRHMRLDTTEAGGIEQQHNRAILTPGH